MKPLEVELPVCEVCRENGIETVGKIPLYRGAKYRAMCSGPPGHDHKQVRMKPHRFVEVPE